MTYTGIDKDDDANTATTFEVVTSVSAVVICFGAVLCLIAFLFGAK